MKDFFKKYSYTAVKLFVNQFAIALFGLGMAFVSAYSGSLKLRVGSSIGAIIFYLFLLYAHMWEVGAKDGIAASARGTSRGLWRGFLLGAIANIPNLLLAIIITVTSVSGVAGGLGQAATAIALMLEGMYFGILSVPIGGVVLSELFVSYFLITVPAILVCGLAYIIGSYNLHVTNILIPKNKDVKNNGRPN
ncbi:MAG: hypothetical protein J6U87_01865 [Clostridia bacterium]|nr:hypothetical protein [Clostridia bacterium]